MEGQEGTVRGQGRPRNGRERPRNGGEWPRAGSASQRKATERQQKVKERQWKVNAGAKFGRPRNDSRRSRKGSGRSMQGQSLGTHTIAAARAQRFSELGCLLVGGNLAMFMCEACNCLCSQDSGCVLRFHCIGCQDAALPCGSVSVAVMVFHSAHARGAGVQDSRDRMPCVQRRSGMQLKRRHVCRLGSATSQCHDSLCFTNAMCVAQCRAAQCRSCYIVTCVWCMTAVIVAAAAAVAVARLSPPSAGGTPTSPQRFPALHGAARRSDCQQKGRHMRHLKYIGCIPVQSTCAPSLWVPLAAGGALCCREGAA